MPRAPEALQHPPPLTVGADGPVLIGLDQRQVHEVSGRNDLHGSRGGGGSGDAQSLPKPRGGSRCVNFGDVILIKSQSHLRLDFLTPVVSWLQEIHVF